MKWFWMLAGKPLVFALFFLCWFLVGIPFLLPFALAFLLHLMIKSLVRRPRPFEEKADAPRWHRLFQTSSFPSGHATSAASFATSVALVQDLSTAAWFALLALLVAAARVKLGVHYVSDVLAGVVLGVLVTTVIFSLL